MSAQISLESHVDTVCVCLDIIYLPPWITSLCYVWPWLNHPSLSKAAYHGWKVNAWWAQSRFLCRLLTYRLIIPIISFGWWLRRVWNCTFPLQYMYSRANFCENFCENQEFRGRCLYLRNISLAETFPDLDDKCIYIVKKRQPSRVFA